MFRKCTRHWSHFTIIGPQLSHGLAWTLVAHWWSWSTLSPKTLLQKRNRRRWRVWKASAATSPHTPLMAKQVYEMFTWSSLTSPFGAARATCTSSAFPRTSYLPSCRWAETSISPVCTPPSVPLEVVHLNMKMTSVRCVQAHIAVIIYTFLYDLFKLINRPKMKWWPLGLGDVYQIGIEQCLKWNIVMDDDIG